MPGRSTSSDSALPKTQPRLLGKDDIPSWTLELPGLDAGEMKSLLTTDAFSKALKIGVARNVDRHVTLDKLTWATDADGGRHATLQIRSAGAAALRAAIAGSELPKELQVAVYGTRQPGLAYNLFDPAGAKKKRRALLWSPVIEGDVLRFELRLRAGTAVPHRALELPQISHLVASIRNPAQWQKSLSDIGMAGACNIDLVCRPDAIEVGRSVAKYVFVENGSSFLCSGTLLNSESGGWFFLTAHHCMSSQAEASTMELYWSFQRESCDGSDPTAVVQTTGGATLRATGVSNDFTLVELNESPPGGALFAGWTNTTIALGSSVVGIHHPAGDLKKVSLGIAQGFANWNAPSSGSTSTHIVVGWSEGVTEGGSSGSGLFVDDRIVGTLHGGGSSCDKPDATDSYGRFDQAFTALQPWLAPNSSIPVPPAPPPPPPPTTELVSGTSNTDSVDQGVSNWYRISSTATQTSLRVQLSALSEDADLYLYKDNQTEEPACSSEEAGTMADQCVIASPGAATWYIEVYGYSAASYTVTATLANPTPPRAPSSGGGGGGRTDELSLLMLLTLVLRWTRRSSLSIIPRLRSRPT